MLSWNSVQNICVELRLRPAQRRRVEELVVLVRNGYSEICNRPCARDRGVLAACIIQALREGNGGLGYGEVSHILGACQAARSTASLYGRILRHLLTGKYQEAGRL